MSKIFVDQVDPKTATTLTLGTTGDTVSIPSGVTLSGAGTITASAANLAASGAGGVTGTLPIANGGTGATTLAGAGLANTPSFSAVLSGSQAIAGSTETKITYNSEQWDTDSAFDTSNNRFIVPSGKAGKYQFNIMFYMGGLANDVNARLKFYKNGSAINPQPLIMIYSSGGDTSAHLSLSIDLSESDYIEIFCGQYAGSSKNLEGNLNYLQGFRIA